MTTRTARTTLTRADWLAAALEVLSSQGIGGVRVLSLAKSLGVTRGSFHWHFKNREDLLEALLEYWGREMTDAVIEHVDSLEGDAKAKIEALAAYVVRTDRTSCDPAVRAWATADPIAEAVVERVDRKRIGYVTRLFRQAGHSAEEAMARGSLLAVYLMGEKMILHGLSVEERLRMLERQLATIFDESPDSIGT